MKRIKELVDSIESENRQELLRIRREKYKNKGRATTPLGRSFDNFTVKSKRIRSRPITNANTTSSAVTTSNPFLDMDDHQVQHIVTQTQSAGNDGIVTANIEEYEKIQSVIAQMREEAIMRSTVNIENIPDDQPSRRWQERQKFNKEIWEKIRASVVQNYVRNQCVPSGMLKCSRCQQTLQNTIIRCLSCKNHFCSKCDYKIHIIEPFHRRYVVRNETMKSLLPSEFFDINWRPELKEIAVPCFVPSLCKNCGSPEMILKPGSNHIAVVNQHGRFDLRSASFYCGGCNSSFEAGLDDYIYSGLWPGVPSVGRYLFDEELLFLYYQTQHLSPGTSEKKFLKSLEEISTRAGRSGTINRPLFSLAYKEWEYCTHRIEVDIQQMKKTQCPACGSNPLTGSCDGCMKLRRLRSAGEARKGKNEKESIESHSRYKDEVIRSDQDVRNHKEKIEEKVLRSKSKEMCGGSVFKAARSDSSKFAKSDETGMVMAPCRHGVIFAAINLHQGETFIHTHFMHNLLKEMNCKYFCNDVICRYIKFAKKVGEAFPEYHSMAQMKVFLPRMHAKAHNWPCQVLYNPHWVFKMGATMGEEHEQVFSKMSRYGNSTKHMSAASRNDHISAAIFYWNREKFESFPFSLRKRLMRATSRVPQYRKELRELLTKFSVNKSDLPIILIELRKLARYCLSMRINAKTPLESLRKDLEGVYVQIQNIKIRISSEAAHCKDRTRLRRTQTKLKAKSLKIMKLLNEKTEEQAVSVEDFENGIFPWNLRKADHSSNQMTTYDKSKIVDTWMLWRRYQEEIIQTKLEILNYLNSLKASRLSLEKQILIDLEAADNIQFPDNEQMRDFYRGKALIANTERERLSVKFSDAFQIFKLDSNFGSHETYFTEDLDFDDGLLGPEEGEDSDSESDCDSAEHLTDEEEGEFSADEEEGEFTADEEGESESCEENDSFDDPYEFQEID